MSHCHTFKRKQVHGYRVGGTNVSRCHTPDGRKGPAVLHCSSEIWLVNGCSPGKSGRLEVIFERLDKSLRSAEKFRKMTTSTRDFFIIRIKN